MVASVEDYADGVTEPFEVTRVMSRGGRGVDASSEEEPPGTGVRIHQSTNRALYAPMTCDSTPDAGPMQVLHSVRCRFHASADAGFTHLGPRTPGRRKSSAGRAGGRWLGHVDPDLEVGQLPVEDKSWDIGEVTRGGAVGRAKVDLLGAVRQGIVPAEEREAI